MPLFGLKLRVSLNIGVALLVGMFLTEVVMVAHMQQQLIRSEIQKAELISLALADNWPDDGNLNRLKSQMSNLLGVSGCSTALLAHADGRSVCLDPCGLSIREQLQTAVSDTILSGRPSQTFSGQTWGIFYKHFRFLIFALPVGRAGEVKGVACVGLVLDDVHAALRTEFQSGLLYMLFNLLLLTLFGTYRTWRLSVRPIEKLVKLTQRCRDEKELLLAYGEGTDEVGKLSRALNRMLNRIAENRRKLESTVSSLESANVQLKMAQAEVVRAEKLATVGRLSAGIAHEIGNPLGIVLGYMDLLKSESLDQAERKEFIVRAEKEMKRIDGIIRTLLELARKPAARLAAVHVHQLILELESLVKPQPLMTHVSWQLDLQASDHTVLADADQLRQVFLNLLINAADAIAIQQDAACGSVTIKTRNTAMQSRGGAKQRPGILITVQDDGCGIAADRLDHIFDPFYTTKAPGKGTGLGLAVSMNIIEGWGGMIKAFSQAGEGTRMSIFLPLVRYPDTLLPGMTGHNGSWKATARL